MGRKVIIPYDEIIAKYQTGEYSIMQLSRDYNVARSAINKYIKDNNIKINKDAQQAIYNIHKGFLHLNQLNGHKKGHLKGHSHLQPYTNSLIVEEVIHIIKQKNPEFALVFQNLSSKILKISNDLLNAGVYDTKDLKNITSAMKDINDTLQVIPKPPAFAQQINFNKDNQITQKEIVKKIEVEIINENTT